MKMMHILKYLTFSLLFFILFAHGAVQGKDWQVNLTNSEIRFSGKHAGADFKGVFERWDADISFDPNKLDTSHVRVTIETASAVTGNGLYDGTLKGKDWFDIENHKSAVFEASSFQALGEKRYRVQGNLTIKGNRVSLPFDFTLDVEGTDAKMTASIPLDRIKHGLGVGSDPDASWVSREIGLDIIVNASVLK